MRAPLAFLLALLSFGACASPNSLRRVLVTDNLHAAEARAEVVSWHEQHQWCRGVSTDIVDEFLACDAASARAGAVESLVEYRDGRVDAIAMLVPVPCRGTGSCDHLKASEKLDPIYRPGEPLVRDITDIGRYLVPEEDIPPMQQRMLDSLELELDHRYGPPEWKNATRSAMAWSAPDGEHITLFLNGINGWVVETHLFGRP
jgi:hypothetical protein